MVDGFLSLVDSVIVTPLVTTNRGGLYIMDKDIVNLSGSTNLSNSSIKVNDRLIQPGSNPPVSGEL